MKKTCFVVMGFGLKTESGKTYNLDKTYKNIIKPAVEACGITCIRGDEVKDSTLIDKSMYALLVQTDLVIADITTMNPNALYELGIRHAVKPYSTIIIKGNESPIPFDISHNRIFHYKHGGDDIGFEETERFRKALIEVIESVMNNKQIDSPLFEFIPSAQPQIIPEEQFSGIIKELADNETHLFGIVEGAKIAMNEGNFEEAIQLWAKAHNNVSEEPYFIQQLALATYKGKEPSEQLALQDALGIIKKLDVDQTTDPETLGITGAIYKRMWMQNKAEMGNLERAIKYYKKGYQLNDDYYTGENYANCLELKAEVEEDEDDKIYFRVEAKRTRKDIIESIKRIMQEDNYETRPDIKWVYATMAVCNYALKQQEEYEKFKALFLEKADADWEKETFENSITDIKRIFGL